MAERDPGMSVEQAAGRLGVSTPTVRRWIRDGLLPDGWRAERFGRGGERTYFLLWGPAMPDASPSQPDASAAPGAAPPEATPAATQLQPNSHPGVDDGAVYERALALARDLTATYRELLDASTEQLDRRDELIRAQERELGTLWERSRLDEQRIIELLEDRASTTEQLARATEQLDATRRALQQQLVATGEALAQREGAVVRADAAEAARAASQSAEHVRALLLRSQRGWRAWLLRWLLGTEALSILHVLR
jgi:excisionase family DNA binding protein